MPEFKCFGEALRYYRRNSQNKLNDFLEFMPCKKAYLMDIEKGRCSPPSDEKILKICDFLKIEDKLEMLSLAAKDRKKLSIDIPDNKTEYRKTMIMLSISKDLSEEKLKKIQKIIGS